MWNDLVEELKSWNAFSRYFMLGALIVVLCLFFWWLLKVVISIIIIFVVGYVAYQVVKWILKLFIKKAD